MLLEANANVEDHNENGHTPLMEAASAGHCSVARILLEFGAGINTHSNEFKESALTLACYKVTHHTFFLPWKALFRIWIRIGVCFDEVCRTKSRSGYRQTKMVPKTKQKLRNFMFTLLFGGLEASPRA